VHPRLVIARERLISVIALIQLKCNRPNQGFSRIGANQKKPPLYNAHVTDGHRVQSQIT
jgi:hypothetical protein